MPRDLIDRHDDFNGNLTKVTLPNAVFVEYSYDNAQRLTGIKDSLNNTVTLNSGDTYLIIPDYTNPSFRCSIAS